MSALLVCDVYLRLLVQLIACHLFLVLDVALRSIVMILLFVCSYYHTKATLARMEAKSGSASTAAAAADSKTASAGGKEDDSSAGGGKDDYDDGGKDADYDEKQDKFSGK